MKKIALFITVFLFLFIHKTIAQIQLDVEGDARIKGSLNVLLSENDSSVIIGPGAGTATLENRLRQNKINARRNIAPENIFIGNQAGASNTLERNTFIGPKAGELNNGYASTFIGERAGQRSTGSHEIAIGSEAGLLSQGLYNISIGMSANKRLNKGHRNIFIGPNASIIGRDSAFNAIAIGSNAKANCNHCAIIGGINSMRVKVGVGTQNPAAMLHLRKDFGGPVTPMAGTEILVESDTQAILSIISPSKHQKGIAFGHTGAAAAAGIFYNAQGYSQDALTFRSGNAINMILTRDGRLGLGTIHPNIQAKLHVQGRFQIGDSEFIEDGGHHNIAIRGDFIPDNPVDQFDLGGADSRWDQIFAMDGVINTSDRREKKRIQKLSYGLKEIMRLRPVQYHWKNKPNDNAKLGLIAQEVQKVIKEVVVDHDYDRDENGNWIREDFEVLGMYYTDLIPVLIKGIQEQQVIINKQEVQNKKQTVLLEKLDQKMAQQQSEIEVLKSQLASLLEKETTKDHILLESEAKAYIKQNEPNPFVESTIIKYYIPTTIKKAQLRISSVNGKTLKIENLSGRAAGQIQIETKNFPAGNYIYSLVLDGKVVASKKMAVAWR
jgi:hypothetical protein